MNVDIRKLNSLDVVELTNIRDWMLGRAMSSNKVIACREGYLFLDPVYDAMNTYIVAIINSKNAQYKRGAK